MPNKVDICNENPRARQVETDEIVKFAQFNNLLYKGETSAKGDINIKESFEALLQ